MGLGFPSRSRPTACSGTDRSEMMYCVVSRSFSLALRLNKSRTEMNDWSWERYVRENVRC